MPVHIRIASNAAELDAVFRARHTVYVNQGGYMKAREDGRIFDRFDCYPRTRNIVALEGGQVVGGVRVMIEDGAGTHADEYYDFRPHLPPGACVGSGSMLFVDQDFRGRPRLTSAMMDMYFYVAQTMGASHLVATVNPEVEQAFYRQGFKPIGAVQEAAEKGVKFRPAILPLPDLAERVQGFVLRQRVAAFFETFERYFYRADEKIFARDEPGGATYLVVNGEVELGFGETRKRLGPGAMFGELAALLDKPRSGDARAFTDLDLLVVQKEVLLARLRTEGEAAFRVIQLLADRLWTNAFEHLNNPTRSL